MQLDSLNLDYDATVSIKQSTKHSWALALQLRMKRKIRRSVVQIICPPGLLVMVSWVWLKRLQIISLILLKQNLFLLPDKFSTPCGHNSWQIGIPADALSLYDQHSQLQGSEFTKIRRKHQCHNSVDPVLLVIHHSSNIGILSYTLLQKVQTTKSDRQNGT